VPVPLVWRDQEADALAAGLTARVGCIYNESAMIEFDPAKNAADIKKHGIALGRYSDLDQSTAIADVSARHGEDRLFVLGVIDGRLHAAVIVMRGDVTRVISLRPAHQDERHDYEQEQLRRPDR
jgi:uncharacterized DUF497 family protein